MILGTPQTLKITLFLKGEVAYTLNQNPEKPIVIGDSRKLEGYRTPKGELVAFGTHAYDPISADFEVFGVAKEVQNLLHEHFEQNLKGNRDYLFAVSFRDVLTNSEILKLSGCVFKQSPIQTSVGESLATLRLCLMAGKIEFF
jgi:hypothetical protein